MPPCQGGYSARQPCPYSANSQTPNKRIISPSHDIIFPFTQSLNGTLYSCFVFNSFSLPWFCLSYSCLLLFQPLPACPLRLQPFFSLSSSLPLTLLRVFALKSLLFLFLFLPLFLSPSLSLEENHTLISLPALFLTSGLARRILTKLLSQLTPKAHNNLLCQQTHTRAAHAYTRTHMHTFAS